METRANFVLIGAFTLAVILGGFLFVLWFSGLGQVSQRKSYEVLFAGSVSGLNRGAAVLFNGLRVGEVTRIDFVPNDPGHVRASIQVESRIPIKQDTQARLEMQGLTGGAAIALTGGAADAAPLVGENGASPIIIAQPSANILESVQNLSARADSVLSKAEKLITDNSGAVTDALKNIDDFSRALGENAKGVDDALAGVAELGRKIGPLAERLQKLSDDGDKLVNAVDPDKVKKVVSDVSTFTGALAESKGAIQSILTDTAALAKRLNDSSGKLDVALSDFDSLVKAVDTKKIANVVDGADALGEVLKQNKGNIDKIIKDAAELTAKLDSSADKVDGLMTSLQGFVGSPDVKGPMAEISDAARSIRKLADDLNARTREIAVGLTHFTSSGLKEYEALAVDGRRTVNDVDRVVRSFEKNPTQLIFGAKPSASNLPEYRGGP